LGREDVLLWAETAGRGVDVVGEGGDAVVAGGEEDGVPLQGELHELVALATDVVVWQVGFGLPVGGGDDVCGLVDAALECACGGEGLAGRERGGW